MKAAVLKGFGSSARFVIENVEKTAIKEDEVLVQIFATSVNPVDWQTSAVLSHVPPMLRRHPIVLGHDLSGIVIKTGANVHHLKDGDEVYGTNGLAIDFVKDRRATTGTYAEFSAVKANKITRKPASISFYESATVPLVALTALQGLKKARLKAGDDILVIGGSGGVGSMAVQIAKAKGAKVSAVCSTRNISMVKDLGADKVFDYTKENYLKMNARFDVVFNTIGHQSITSCSNLVSRRGIYVDCAAPSLTGSVGLTRRYVMPSSHKNVFFLYHASQEDLEEITNLIETEKIRPGIAKQIDLSEINQGHTLNKTGSVSGKIAVAIKPVR